MARRNFVFSIVILSVMLLWCKTEPQTTEPSIYGLWEMPGYGQLIEIDSSKIKVYDITKTTCFPIETIELRESAVLGKRIALYTDSMILMGGITEYRLKRLPHPIKRCNGNDTVPLKDPVYNFEVFWNTFNEFYSSFKQRKIDWNNIYRVYKPKISQSTTDEKLYTMLSGIIDQLGDGHSSLDVPELIRKNESQEKEHENSPKKVRETILSRYLRNYKSSGQDKFGKGLVSWGVLSENVGYLQINSMMFYADYEIPNNIEGDEFSELYNKRAGNDQDAYQREINRVEQIMNKVISDFMGVRSIILDIRMNEGGYDGVALKILSYFTKERTFVFSKKARLGQDYTVPQKIFIVPAENVFSGSIFLLTSNNTASAAEIFTLSSMALKNVTRIGSATEGIFSDVLEKKLPNGWTFSLSNEVYENVYGENFESIGIRPHINLEYPLNADEFNAQLMKDLLTGDRAINRTLEEIKKL